MELDSRIPDTLSSNENFCRDDGDEVVKRGSLYCNSNEVRQLKKTDSLAAKGKTQVHFGIIINSLCDEDFRMKEPSSEMSHSKRNHKFRFGLDRNMPMNHFVKSFILGREEKENQIHNMSSPAHLHGILKVGNGVRFLEFSVKSPEDLYMAKVRKLESGLTWVYDFHSLLKRKTSDRGPSMVGEMHVSCHPCMELQKDAEELYVSTVTESVLYNNIHSRKSNSNRWGNCEKKVMSVNKEGIIKRSFEGVGFKSPASQPELEIAAIVVQKEGSIHVVIPSGNHSLPVITSESDRNGPSRLVDRWRLGGGCDCGGWDMACPINVFSNLNVDSQYPTRLFSQGKRDDIPAFEMRVIGEGKYAVDFHARLSSLQAFSICVSIMHAAEVSRRKSSQVSRIDWPRIHEKEIVGKTIEATIEEKEGSEQVISSLVLNPQSSPIARV